MDLVLVQAADALPVSLAEAKAHLRVDHDDEDAVITSLITAATTHLDGPAGILGRALGEQTWTLYLPTFPACEIRPPLAPLIDVEEITYLDSSGVRQTMEPDTYVAFAGVDGAIEPEYGQSWPSARYQRRSVAITFNVGHDPIPSPIQTWILMTVASLYDVRPSSLSGSGSIIITPNPIVDQMLAPYGGRHIR